MRKKTLLTLSWEERGTARGGHDNVPSSKDRAVSTAHIASTYVMRKQDVLQQELSFVPTVSCLLTSLSTRTQFLRKRIVIESKRIVQPLV